MKLAKYNMIEQQLRPWDVLDEYILSVVAQINREDFVPSAYRKLAFADAQLPIGHEQVMLEPKLQARIVQDLQIKPTDTVLEIGTGTGYMTALLARCAKHVVSVDIFADFTQKAAKNLENAGIINIELLTQDASTATAEVLKNKYDVIVVTAALPAKAKYLEKQLTLGGRLFTIVGQKPAMAATITTKNTANSLRDNIIFETVIPFLLNVPTNQAFKF